MTVNLLIRVFKCASGAGVFRCLHREWQILSVNRDKSPSCRIISAHIIAVGTLRNHLLFLCDPETDRMTVDTYRAAWAANTHFLDVVKPFILILVYVYFLFHMYVYIFIHVYIVQVYSLLLIDVGSFLMVWYSLLYYSITLSSYYYYFYFFFLYCI